MLALGGQPPLRCAVLRCSGTSTQVTSAYLCGSLVLKILRNWHCESLKCHLLFMESQQSLKAWTLATNRDGFFAFEVAKSKAQSMEDSCNANCKSRLYDVDGCPLGAEMRLISSHHKKPQNGNCCHLTFTHYQSHQNCWLFAKSQWNGGKDNNEKHRQVVITQASRSFHDTHVCFKGIG